MFELETNQLEYYTNMYMHQENILPHRGVGEESKISLYSRLKQSCDHEFPMNVLNRIKQIGI